MALPNPPFDLGGSCTAVYNNSLYIYSPAGFQSISLSQGASWQILPPGVSVTGAVCVNANSTNTTPALYIVGGTANATQPDYPGLQRYDYNSNTWENISPAVLVTQNRRNHGASFLPASSSIVVYAGSQDANNNLPSSQTFLVSTNPPYQVLSFVSLAPPLTIPMLMPWNDSHALMVGGSTDNTNLYLFSATGWSELGTALTDPIADETTVQCDIVTGDDGSKVLQKYNMGVSPNTVTGILLWKNGAPVPPGTLVGTGTANPKVKSRMMRRDLTVANWPAYNATGAPTTTREGFSVAQAPNGYAIISGGSTTNPVVVFSETQNSWVDNNNVFGSQSQIPINPSSTAVSSSKPSSTIPSTSTSTSTPSTSSAPASTPPPANHALLILGATLGAVLGFAAILIILLLLLRWHSDRETKRHKERRQQEEKENRLSFADQGTAYMQTAGAGKDSRPYTEHERSDSVTSPPNMPGQYPPGSSHSRATHTRGPSDGSTLGLMAHRGPAGGPSPDDGHHGYGSAAAVGGLAAVAGAGAAMELSNMHRREDVTKSPSSGGLVNSPYSHPLPPVQRGLDTQEEEEEESQGRSTGGWSTYFANDSPVGGYPSSNQQQQQQQRQQQPDRHNQMNSFLHSAPSTRSSELSLSEYEPTNPSRQNSNIRPLELNLGPKFSTSGPSGVPAALTHAGGPPGRAISTSTYDPSHWSVLSDDRISPRTSLAHVAPLGSGQPVGNAFAVPGNPLTNPLPPIPAGLSYSQAQNQHVRDRLGMGGYSAPRSAPSPPPTTALPPFPRSESQQSQGVREGGREMDSPSPPVPRAVARGPVLRKMTGDEDMSWLNINAGR